MTGIYRRYVKRLLDIIISLAVITGLSPVYIITALLVKKKLGSPVLFSQLRPGYQEKIFRMYKFRSMTDETDENGNLLPDEIRLTPFGAKLRETSLDELPEMFNILKGDMSVVGPYDQGLTEAFKEAFSEYVKGECSKEEALKNFYDKAVIKFPELTYDEIDIE